MPSRDFELRIQDMLTEIEVVEDTVKDLIFETFAEHEVALRDRTSSPHKSSIASTP